MTAVKLQFVLGSLMFSGKKNAHFLMIHEGNDKQPLQNH